MKYKVKAIISFNDLEANTHRNIGDVFEVNEGRKDYLLEHKAIEVFEEVKEKNKISFVIAEKLDDEHIQPLDEEAANKLSEEIEKHIEVKPKITKNKKSSKK